MLLIFKPPSLIRKGSDRKMEKMGVKEMSTDTLAKEMLDAVKK
ncbi:MAG: hypothetical protein PHR52_10745 [Fermentimonas sp.]|nr:hypothetical protein [Fermentimonas sp.]